MDYTDKKPMATDKKIIRKISSAVITLALLLSLSPILWAEDYPAAYLEAGYRDYLSGKIQNGYYVEVFTRIDTLQKERVEKRSEIEKMVTSTYQAGAEAANGILATGAEQKYNAESLNVEIAKRRLQREQVASANVEGGFTYIPYSDGKIVYFKDGLAIRVENERVVDGCGNLSIKNTYNMQYNDKRLLTSYEANLTDNSGNTTHLCWYGAKYTADSLFYGGSDTNANKNLLEYYLKEVDSKGNEKLTHWNGLSYEGKLLRAFSETIEDKVNGNTSFTRSNITSSSYHEEGVGYSLDRTDVTYNNKDQLTGYREVVTTAQPDGTKTKTTTDAKFKYLAVTNQFGPDAEDAEPDRLLESVITSNVENADGSIKTETTATTYNYEGDKLIGASGHTEFNGKEAQWQDPVTQTLKDGMKFNGSSDAKYEILYGTPMAKQVDSLTNYYNPEDGNLIRTENSTVTYNNGLVNNLQRTLGSQEHTETTYSLIDADNTHKSTRDITLTYSYNEKGNFVDAIASGTESGWEYSSEKGWYGKYEKEITIGYDVILNKVLQKTYHEDKDYVVTDASSTNTIQSSTDINYVYNSYGVAISSIQTTNTTTKITTSLNSKKVTTTTISVETVKSSWRGSGLKTDSITGTYDASGSDRSSSHTESSTNYTYNEYGQLTAATGGSTTTGKRAAGGTFESNTVNNYILKNGIALISSSTTTGKDYNTSGKKTSDFKETVNYTYELVAGSWQIMKEVSASTSIGVDGGVETITRTKTYQRDGNGVCTGITQTASGTYTYRGRTYTMRNYKAEFKFDAQIGWYLASESYSWPGGGYYGYYTLIYNIPD